MSLTEDSWSSVNYKAQVAQSVEHLQYKVKRDMNMNLLPEY